MGEKAASVCAPVLVALEQRATVPRTYEVRLSALNKIASALGVSAKDLFEDVPGE